MTEGRYLIGIDLGTSNCSLSYIDKRNQEKGIQSLEIEQWDQGGIVYRSTLPSFSVYLSKGQLKRDEGRLPCHPEDYHPKFIVGAKAKDLCSEQADQVIHSSKSWLSHRGVERTAKILPWHSDSILGDKRLSPVDAAQILLEHLKFCWDSKIATDHPSSHFSNQKIVITVPASFDSVSQELTLKAATEAGFPSSVELLEEPQAAFYWWQKLNIEKKKKLSDGHIVVCDVGGGTSDFSLLKFAHQKLSRIRVSDHILLGGDNIDLAIAKHLEQKLSPDTPLSSYPWAQLIADSRKIKESLLGESAHETYHVSISSEGSSLFTSTMSCSANKDELLDLVEGFYPSCVKGFSMEKEMEGISEFGLPYAQDPAITHHLSHFLDGQAVDYILFAGGSMKPSSVREKIITEVEGWQDKRPTLLTHQDLDLAVSKGAAAYLEAMEEKDQSGIIESHYPHYLFLAVIQGNDTRGLCILPKGHRRGESLTIDRKLKARLNQSVSFQIFSSPQELGLNTGDTIDIAQLTPVSRITGKLSTSDKNNGTVEVELAVTVSETGLLKLTCNSADKNQSWPLSFDLSSRNSSSMDSQVKIDQQLFQRSKRG